jgi:hypothetical protein
MKKMVMLAVLVVSLLLVTGTAFAVPSCDSCSGVSICYKVTGTDLTNPANSFTEDWLFCVVNPFAAYVCDTTDDVPPFLALSLFPDILIPQAISWDSGTRGAHMKFHGDIFNGEYFNQPDRYLLHAIFDEQCPLLVD